MAMTYLEEAIRYFANPRRKLGAWKWHHKDFTYSYLGKIGSRIIADERQRERGFDTPEEAIAFAKTYRDRAIELLKELDYDTAS